MAKKIIANRERQELLSSWEENYDNVTEQLSLLNAITGGTADSPLSNAIHRMFESWTVLLSENLGIDHELLLQYIYGRGESEPLTVEVKHNITNLSELENALNVNHPA